MKKENRTRKSNGSGSIYFDEKGKKWLAEIQWTDKNGEKHRKKFSGQKQVVVKNKLEEFKKQLILSSGNISADSITFEEYADYWLRSELSGQLKPSSLMRKEVTLRNQVYPYIGNITMGNITRFDLNEMVKQLKNKNLSYSTIKKAVEAVNGCFKNYRINTGIQTNPCEGVMLPVNQKRDSSDIVFFNVEQYNAIEREAIRKYSNNQPVYRLGHAIVVLMYTGMRIGELIALTWNDVDFENREITISKNAVVAKVDLQNKNSHYEIINQDSTKTKSGIRVIPMTQKAFDSLKEIYKITGNQTFVLCSKNNRQISFRNINRMFHCILNKAGIDPKNGSCGVHTLRHTFASMLFQNGCEVKVVSEILGHADTKITENIYIHLIKKQKVKAIQDIDKFTNKAE